MVRPVRPPGRESARSKDGAISNSEDSQRSGLFGLQQPWAVGRHTGNEAIEEFQDHNDYAEEAVFFRNLA